MADDHIIGSGSPRTSRGQDSDSGTSSSIPQPPLPWQQLDRELGPVVQYQSFKEYRCGTSKEGILSLAIQIEASGILSETGSENPYSESVQETMQKRFGRDLERRDIAKAVIIAEARLAAAEAPTGEELVQQRDLKADAKLRLMQFLDEDGRSLLGFTREERFQRMSDRVFATEATRNEGVEIHPIFRRELKLLIHNVIEDQEALLPEVIQMREREAFAYALQYLGRQDDDFFQLDPEEQASQMIQAALQQLPYQGEQALFPEQSLAVLTAAVADLTANSELLAARRFESQRSREFLFDHGDLTISTSADYFFSGNSLVFHFEPAAYAAILEPLMGMDHRYSLALTTSFDPNRPPYVFVRKDGTESVEDSERHERLHQRYESYFAAERSIRIAEVRARFQELPALEDHEDHARQLRADFFISALDELVAYSLEEDEYRKVSLLGGIQFKGVLNEVALLTDALNEPPEVKSKVWEVYAREYRNWLRDVGKAEWICQKLFAQAREEDEGGRAPLTLEKAQVLLQDTPVEELDTLGPYFGVPVAEIDTKYRSEMEDLRQKVERFGKEIWEANEANTLARLDIDERIFRDAALFFAPLVNGEFARLYASGILHECHAQRVIAVLRDSVGPLYTISVDDPGDRLTLLQENVPVLEEAANSAWRIFLSADTPPERNGGHVQFTERSEVLGIHHEILETHFADFVTRVPLPVRANRILSGASSGETRFEQLGELFRVMPYDVGNGTWRAALPNQIFDLPEMSGIEALPLWELVVRKCDDGLVLSKIIGHMHELLGSGRTSTTRDTVERLRNVNRAAFLALEIPVSPETTVAETSSLIERHGDDSYQSARIQALRNMRDIHEALGIP